MSDYETTLLVKQQCFVYKPPALHEAKGYKAKEWNLSEPLWTGRLVVKGKGQDCVIYLENDDGTPFAKCPVTAGKGPESVEKVLDSSRYFVLRIVDDGGRAAFIGMGFNERNDAFDFTAAIQDHKRYYEQQQELERTAEERSKQPALDLSLKDGQTLKINIPTKKSNSSSSRRRRAAENDDDDDDGLFLPPPPEGGSSSSSSNIQPPQQQQQQQQQSAHQYDPFAGFGGPPPQQQQQPFGGQQQQPFGGQQQQPFGGQQQQPFGGQQQQPFGGQQQPFGGQQQPFGGQQQPFGGQQQQPFGGQQQQQPPSFGSQPAMNVSGGPQAFPGMPLQRQQTPFGDGAWPL